MQSLIFNIKQSNLLNWSSKKTVSKFYKNKLILSSFFTDLKISGVYKKKMKEKETQEPSL